MRLKSMVSAIAAMFFATALAAQMPVPSPLAPPALEPENTLVLDLTTGGRVTIQLRPDVAPNHVERIKALARRGFYNGTIFHRVIEGFMAQGGDPTGTGTGGSELPDLAAEFNRLPHVRGAVAAARGQEVNSANSQFYIMLAPRLQLDKKYSVFGRVVSGMQYVDTIERGEPPANPARIVRASIGTDNAPPPTAAELTAARAAPPPRPAITAPAPAPTSLTPTTPAESPAPAADAPATTAPENAPPPATTPEQPAPAPSPAPVPEAIANPGETSSPQEQSAPTPTPETVDTPTEGPTPQ